MKTIDKVLSEIELVESKYLIKNGTKPNLLICIGVLTHGRLQLENSYETDRIRFNVIDRKIGGYNYLICENKEFFRILVIEEVVDVDVED